MRGSRRCPTGSAARRRRARASAVARSPRSSGNGSAPQPPRRRGSRRPRATAALVRNPSASGHRAGNGFATSSNGLSSCLGEHEQAPRGASSRPAANSAYGRHRRDGSRPSGNTKAIASGQAKNTGHSEETSAAHDPPGSDPGCCLQCGPRVRLSGEHGGERQRAEDEDPADRVAEAAAPRSGHRRPAGAATAATTNGYSHHAPDPETCCAAAIRSNTSPPAISAKAASARRTGGRRDAVCTRP